MNVDIPGRAAELVAGLMATPWGQVSPSVYETGRLVTLAPWLAGHRERIAYLLAEQGEDGSWGPPDGYRLVPTLSATEALMSAARDGGDVVLRAAAEAGLAALRRLLASPPELPDTPAIDLIVPSLVALIDAHGYGEPLPRPAGLTGSRLRHVQGLLESGAEPPKKVLHVLEAVMTPSSPASQGTATPTGTSVLSTPGGTDGVPSPLTGTGTTTGTLAPPTETDGTTRTGGAAGTDGATAIGGTTAMDGATRTGRAPGGGDATGTGGTARTGGAAGVVPTAIGTVGASPAATAAWLGGASLVDSADSARQHLEAVVRRFGGPVPVGLPITVFERGWVLSWLVRAGVPVEPPPEMVADLRAAIGPEGTPAGAGLPADADTTSVALYALALLGVPCDPASLLVFDTGEHFCTWQGEDGSSPSVNAHVLDALGQYVRVRPEAAGRYGPVMERVAGWLAGRQREDGSWDDRWHASPYYATLGCALALGAFGGAEHAGAVLRAREWVLSTQRDDGSWGRWAGMPEETAYAVQTLLLSGPEPDERHKRAAGRGYDYLLQVVDLPHFPPMWHDKDLYSPTAIVRAAVLAALHVAENLTQHEFNRKNRT